jgi:hypothetical protein
VHVAYSARSLALLTTPLEAGGDQDQDQGRRPVIGRKGILSRIPLRIVARYGSYGLLNSLNETINQSIADRIMY